MKGTDFLFWTTGNHGGIFQPCRSSAFLKPRLGTEAIFSSVQFSRSVMSDSLQTHGLQHARLPCPSPTSRAYSNSCPSSWWCHPTISSSVVPFSSRLQSFPASGLFPMSQFASGVHSIGVSAWEFIPFLFSFLCWIFFFFFNSRKIILVLSAFCFLLIFFYYAIFETNEISQIIYAQPIV